LQLRDGDYAPENMAFDGHRILWENFLFGNTEISHDFYLTDDFRRTHLFDDWTYGYDMDSPRFDDVVSLAGDRGTLAYYSFCELDCMFGEKPAAVRIIRNGKRSVLVKGVADALAVSGDTIAVGLGELEQSSVTLYNVVSKKVLAQVQVPPGRLTWLSLSARYGVAVVDNSWLVFDNRTGQIVRMLNAPSKATPVSAGGEILYANGRSIEVLSVATAKTSATHTPVKVGAVAADGGRIYWTEPGKRTSRIRSMQLPKG
jgi:hypothetical protein